MLTISAHPVSLLLDYNEEEKNISKKQEVYFSADDKPAIILTDVGYET